MWKRIKFALGFSALCTGLAAIPANAGIISRTANFLFPCDGANQVVNINAFGFPANSTQGILGGMVILFENRGGLQYVLLNAQADTTKMILAMGMGDVSKQTT